MSVSLDNLVVGNLNTGIKFQFTTKNVIPLDAIFEIDIPSEIQFQSNLLSNKCEIQGGVQVGCQLTFSNSQRKVIITQLISSSVGAQQPFYVKLLQSVRNPYSTRPVTENTFNLQIKTKENQPVDQKLSFGQLAVTTPSDISNANILRESPMNGQLTKYRFDIIFSTLQGNNAIMFITFPSFTINTGLTCTSPTISSTQILAPTLECNKQSSDQIRIVLKCNDAAACPNNYIPSLSIIYISIDSIHNPRSFKPTQPITLYTKTDDDLYQISTKSSGIVLTNTQRNQLLTQPLSTANGAYGELDSYTIKFTATNPLT